MAYGYGYKDYGLGGDKAMAPDAPGPTPPADQRRINPRDLLAEAIKGLVQGVVKGPTGDKGATGPWVMGNTED